MFRIARASEHSHNRHGQYLFKGATMKTYNIFKHPMRGFEAVKAGFSWPAFFFGFFWMFVKKLWGWAGLWIGAYIICSLIDTVVADSRDSGASVLMYLILFVAYIALWLVPAFKGNKWREENLAKRGYELLSSVQAEMPDAAVAHLAKQTQ